MVTFLPVIVYTPVFSDPPSDVTIQQGEGTTIFCDHGSIVVEWYQGETEIDGDNQQDSCSCVSGRSMGQTSINLTFTDITTANAGTYGCWTTNANGTFTKCNFEVVVTGMMHSGDMRGDRIRRVGQLESMHS